MWGCGKEAFVYDKMNNIKYRSPLLCKQAQESHCIGTLSRQGTAFFDLFQEAVNSADTAFDLIHLYGIDKGIGFYF